MSIVLSNPFRYLQIFWTCQIHIGSLARPNFAIVTANCSAVESVRNWKNIQKYDFTWDFWLTHSKTKDWIHLAPSDIFSRKCVKLLAMDFFYLAIK